MLKERAKKSIPITDKMWDSVNKDYRKLVEEYLREQRTKQTKKQYTSALRQFGWYLYNDLDNKDYWKITKREANNYVNYLLDLNMSSSAINLKKSAISSLNNYIETYIVDDDERYATFRNFMRGLKPVDKTITNDKSQVITIEEYNHAIDVLTKQDRLLEVAWLAIAFYTGSRRNEIRQLKTEIVNYKIKENATYITSHIIRGKGKGQMGKVFSVNIPLNALKHASDYVQSRGFDHECIFSYKDKRGAESVIYESWANDFCDKLLSKILGRKITPHILRHSSITMYLEKGVDIDIVSKFVAHHEDVSTTQIYDHRDNSGAKNDLYKL